MECFLNHPDQTVTWHNQRMEYNLALAGRPVKHSLSPVMHTAALEKSGLAGKYVLEECTEDGMRELVGRLRHGDLQGLNVTMPHKALAAELADELTPLARISRSVNSMKMNNGRLWGHSTDATAFQQALGLSRFSGDGPVLVLGAGGAAAALLAAVDRSVFVSARDGEKALRLCDRFPSRDCHVVEFGAGVVGALVVNATPLGMAGESLPEGILEVSSGLIDLAYGADETPAVEQAHALGLEVLDGFEFLALQAADSFRWWTGKTVGVGLMAQAARNA
jgi:shikimate dehydrogenase